MENDSNDDLKFQNEIEKLKLQAEFGGPGFFSPEGGSNLPPEIEAQWLKNIRAYEEQHLDVKVTTVRAAIGNPELKPVAEIPDDEINGALEDILTKMGTGGIALDFDNEVPEREIYRFITEELLDHEMEQMDIPGMVNHFIYEEFYPNHEKDIHRRSDEFILQLFDKKEESLQYYLDRELVFSNGTMMTEKDFIAKARLWFEAYESFTINKLLYMAPKFDMEQGLGHIDLYIDYDANALEGFKQNFIGPGIIYVHFNYGGWFVCGMDFPGFKEWALE